MSIDLGNNPVGSTPTDAQKTQLRSSIGLGSSDTVEFGEIATSQFNFPDLTTSELNSVNDATAGDTYFDSDRGQFVRFLSSSAYEVVSMISSVQQDTISPSSAISLQDSKFFESGLVASESNIFSPTSFVTIYSDEGFGTSANVSYVYNDGNGGVVTEAGWLDTNNPFGGVVTSPVVVPNRTYRITTGSDVTSFTFNKIIVSDDTPNEVFSEQLLGGSEYQIDLQCSIGDLLQGNLSIGVDYTGLYDNSTLSCKVDDLKNKEQVCFLSGKLLKNDFLTFSSLSQAGVDSPTLGLYTLKLIIRPASAGTFSMSARQVVPSVNPLLLGKVETTITKLV